MSNGLDDIIKDKGIDQIIKLNKVVNQADDDIDKMTSTIEKLIETVGNLTSSGEAYEKAQKRANDVYKEVDAIQSKLEVAQKKLIELDEKRAKQIADLNKKLKDVNTAKKDSAKTDKEAEKAAIAAAKAEAAQAKAILATKEALGKQRASEYAKELRAQEKATLDAAKAQDKYNREHKDELVLLNKESGAREKAVAKLNILRKERQGLTLDTVESNERLIEINNEINEHNQLLAETSDKLAQTKIGIGEYTEGMSAALEGSELLSGGFGGIMGKLTEMSQQEGGVKKAFKSITGGIKSATKAALKFILTPIGAILFAIVALFALFTAAIRKNEKAGDMLAKIWKGITVVIDEVIGRVSKLIGGLSKLISGDLKGGFADLKGSVTGFKDAMVQAYNEGAKLIDLQIALEEANISATISQEKLNNKLEQYDVIIGDSTKSFAEREAAAVKSREAREKFSATEKDLAAKELEIINLQVTQAIRQGSINRELRQEQADAMAKMIQAEGSYTLAVANNDKERAELKQDRLEKDLDILIDGFDNQKTINERILADDTLTINERQKLLDQTYKLADDSYQAQGNTIQQFTDKKLNLDKLVATQDAIALNEKIRSFGLSEIIEGRLLEVIRERRMVVQDLGEAQKDLNTETTAEAKKVADELSKIAQLEANAIIRERERKYELDVALIEATVENEEEKVKLISKLNIDLLDEQIANTQILLNNSELSKENRISLEEELKDKQLEINKLRIESDNEVGDNQKKIDEERKERILELASEIAEIGNKAFEFSTALRDRELADLEDKSNKGVISEKQYALKTSEIKRKQAIADRAQALFGIAVNTALGVAKVTGQTGVGAVLAVPLVLASGALQAAAVLAQPLPKVQAYGKGTQSGLTNSSGFVAGDSPTGGAASELMFLSTGQVMQVEKPTYFEGPRFGGAKIIPMKGIDQTSIPRYGNESRTDNIKLIEKMDEVIKAVKEAPTPIYKDSVWIGDSINGSQRLFVEKMRFGR